MKKDLNVTIEIPEGVSANLEGDTLTIKGKEGEITRRFKFGRVNATLVGNKLTLGNEKSTKTEKKLMNTIAAHIENMIKGVQEKFVYELKICFGHFPFTVKKEGNKAIIKNFLGEKVDRVVNLTAGTDVEIDKNMIFVKSVNKELAGNCSAKFEAATKIRGRDKRIFQDGIYIIKKNGKEI
ncbi:50S ribosomal protein L6 [archaeon]|nr:50S ribosomal protein L6 [archaeon]